MLVVVPSCPSYSDTWQPFGALCERYWPEVRPLLITARADGYPTQCDVLELPSDHEWCGNVEAGLDARPEDAVVILQDDFFLSAPVDHAFVEHCVELLRAHPDVAYVRLYPCPGPAGDAVHGEPRLATFLRDQRFLVSCQATLWRTSVLRQVLAFSRGRAARFERRGTRFAHWRLPSQTFWGVRTDAPWPVHYVCTAVVHGRWNPDAIKLCEREGIEVDLGRRGVLLQDPA